MTSLYEGLPVVGIEAQTSGLKTFFSTNITEEASIDNKLTKFIPLDFDEKYWATEILKYYNNYERENMSKIVTEKGYDIHEQSKNLTKLYEEYIEQGETT